MLSLHIDTARDWRGGQRLVFQTVTGLRAAGTRAMLVAHPDGELLARMREGLDLIPLAPRSDIDLSAAWKLSRVIRQVGPDIIHAHDPHGVAMAATALSIATPDPRPALIATRHSNIRVAQNSFSRWKYSQVDHFVAGSGTARDRLIADGIPRQKVSVINLGVDIERIDRAIPASIHAEFWLPHDAPIVGNIAALVPPKGHRHLLDAAGLVVRRVPDARFVIVGDGELRPALEREIHHQHLERHVVLAGFRSDVLELLQGFDLVVSSSLVEGASMAILEAMAAGKAVVATATGNIPELVREGRTGYIVQPGDDRAMADRLISLLRDETTRREFGMAGRARAASLFTLERMVEEVIELYASLRRNAAPGARTG